MSDKRRGRILFLSVPETLREQISESFTINPDIPIPVEIPEGEEQFNLEDLSWEMIISGMLSVIAQGAELPEWISYYRHFVLAVRPSILWEFTEAAILKARNGDFDMAMEILDALTGLFPASPQILLNRALVLEERASAFERQESASAGAETAIRAAEAAYEEVLRLVPPFPPAFFNAGFFYLQQKNYSRAKECFAVYTGSGDDDDKKEQANAIIKNIDDNGLEDECFNEAYALIRQGEEEAALRRIREFIEKYPSVWNGWFVLGWALRRMGRWEDGAAAFGKALELGGTNTDTRNELAICMMETGDLKGARHELETALREDPENVKIISNLGVLALKADNREEANGFFRTVLELAPDDPIANNFFDKISRRGAEAQSLRRKD